MTLALVLKIKTAKKEESPESAATRDSNVMNATIGAMDATKVTDAHKADAIAAAGKNAPNANSHKQQKAYMSNCAPLT